MKDTFSARRLLFPLIPLYRLALAWRSWRLRSGLEPVRRLRFTVISIGNLSTGGAGKTPLTVALAKALTRRGLRVDVLSRGYGRQCQLAARVNPSGTAEEFGDEPLLIAREAGVPGYVAPQRYNAGLLAEAEELPDSGALPDRDEPGAPSLRVPGVAWETSILNRLLSRRRTIRSSFTFSTMASSTANSPATSTYCFSIAAIGPTLCSPLAISASRSRPPTVPPSSPSLLLIHN